MGHEIRGETEVTLSALIAAMETGAAELAERASHGDLLARQWAAHLLADLIDLKLMNQTRDQRTEWMT